MIAYTLSTLLAVGIMFGLPALAAWVLMHVGPALAWNRRRLTRARRYRAVHGTPWWVLETERAQRQRWWLERSIDRTEQGCSRGPGWRHG